ncbi:MAG: type B 50S ribosomal protein L31 [Nocardioidaceae bacterium]|nr:MAG: type B 50S ribosomal protein L31 [Nocardioidaceae bacterium]
MKQDIHPAYGPVVFRDRSEGTLLLTRSTLVSRLAADHPVVTWEDGASYPVVDVDITSTSHPFWTGRGRVVDSEGRVEKFNRRYSASQEAGR